MKCFPISSYKQEENNFRFGIFCLNINWEFSFTVEEMDFIFSFGKESNMTDEKRDGLYISIRGNKIEAYKSTNDKVEVIISGNFNLKKTYRYLISIIYSSENNSILVCNSQIIIGKKKQQLYVLFYGRSTGLWIWFHKH